MQAMGPHDDDFTRLGIAPEKDLQFDHFTNEDALSLGLLLIHYAKEKGQSIAIHIERNRVPLFTYLMSGTSEEHVYGFGRKKRVVDHYNHGSLYIGKRFEVGGMTHDEQSLLPDYQAVGGSFPIRIQNADVIGPVTVAGPAPQLDHDYAVAGVRYFYRKAMLKIACCSWQDIRSMRRYFARAACQRSRATLNGFQRPAIRVCVSAAKRCTTGEGSGSVASSMVR
ncbi:MAG: heme-binding protein [Sporolactobacillus sp.]